MHKFIPAFVFTLFFALAMLDACSTAKNMSSDSSAAIPAVDSSVVILDGACAADAACTEQSRSIPESASADFVCDIRDGQVYKTVKIGSQTWMAENLNYETVNSYCYDDRMSNCLQYGRLYTWNAAVEACPAGYHLPDTAEWNTLIDELGGETIAALSLKSKSGWYIDWRSPHGNGSDSSGFSGLPAGMRSDEGDSVYLDMENSAFFWSSTDIISSFAYGMSLDKNFILDERRKKNAYSVRCIKGEKRENDAVSSKLIGDFLTDSRDGQSYKIVKIGTQTWMAQNLNYETENSDCFNDRAVNCAEYGRLYTWSEAMKVCPAGYHLPDTVEWKTLFATVGGQAVAGKSLKAQTGWLGNGNGIDSFGFNALPAGEKDFWGDYGVGDKYAYFLSFAPEDSAHVYYTQLISNRDDVKLLDDQKNEMRKLSVRCVKD